MDEVDTESIVSKYPFYEFDPECVKRLNRIVKETNSKIVISSTWRIGQTPLSLQKLLETVGFEGEVISVTPHFYAKGNDIDGEPIGYTVPRGCEIDWWLDSEGKYERRSWSEESGELVDISIVENFVILDDDSDMLLKHKDNFIQTSPYDGLNEKLTEKCIKILNKK
jgi:hypothetical protein